MQKASWWFVLIFLDALAVLFTFWISSRRFIKPREHKNTCPLVWFHWAFLPSGRELLVHLAEYLLHSSQLSQQIIPSARYLVNCPLTDEIKAFKSARSEITGTVSSCVPPSWLTASTFGFFPLWTQMASPVGVRGGVWVGTTRLGDTTRAGKT